MLAIAAGFVALYARKGSTTHRRFGRVFAYAMVVMTLSAVMVAAFLRPNPGNIVAGTTTFYLVCTGWLAVARTVAASRAWLVGLATAALGISAYAFGIGGIAWQLPGRSIAGIPAVALLMFGVVALLAALGDVRLIRRGHLEGPARLLRHLWRLGFAMWIAVSSFFLGQADEFPAAVRASGVLSVPVLAVAATLLYWVVKQTLAVRRHRHRTQPAQPVAGLSSQA
ncbi:MAG TPA: hypothetical protein VEY50_10190 [Lysobacter sp.]|nr:hypothetical protein [Lysobacter sp.]